MVLLSPFGDHTVFAAAPARTGLLVLQLAFLLWWSHSKTLCKSNNFVLVSLILFVASQSLMPGFMVICAGVVWVKCVNGSSNTSWGIHDQCV